MSFEHPRHLLTDGEMRIQRRHRVLKNHRHRAATETIKLLLRQL